MPSTNGHVPYPELNLSRVLGIRALSPVLYFKDATGVVHLLLTPEHGVRRYILSFTPHQLQAMLRAKRFTTHEVKRADLSI